MKLIKYLFVAAIVFGYLQNAEAQDVKKSTKKSDTTNGVGAWLHEYEWEGATSRDVFRIKSIKKDGKVVGALYRNDDKPRPLQKATIKDGKISFEVSGERDGTAWLTKYEGKIGADSIDGTVILEVGDQKWDFPWKPVKTVEFLDVVGSWQLRIEGPNGNVFEPVLKIERDKKKFKASYNSPNLDEITLSDLKIKDNQLCWKITFEYEGNEVNITYQCKPANGKLTGKLEYEAGGQTGEGEFTGTLMKKK